MDDIAGKKVQLAALRSQVATLELELTRVKTCAPALVPNAPAVAAQPPFEHVDYHSYRGNIGPQGLGWQRLADEAALSTEELRTTRAYVSCVCVLSPV